MHWGNIGRVVCLLLAAEIHKQMLTDFLVPAACIKDTLAAAEENDNCDVSN